MNLVSTPMKNNSEIVNSFKFKRILYFLVDILYS